MRCLSTAGCDRPAININPFRCERVEKGTHIFTTYDEHRRVMAGWKVCEMISLKLHRLDELDNLHFPKTWGAPPLHSTLVKSVARHTDTACCNLYFKNLKCKQIFVRF